MRNMTMVDETEPTSGAGGETLASTQEVEGNDLIAVSEETGVAHDERNDSGESAPDAEIPEYPPLAEGDIIKHVVLRSVYTPASDGAESTVSIEEDQGIPVHHHEGQAQILLGMAYSQRFQRLVPRYVNLKEGAVIRMIDGVPCLIAGSLASKPGEPFSIGAEEEGDTRRIILLETALDGGRMIDDSWIEFFSPREEVCLVLGLTSQIRKVDGENTRRCVSVTALVRVVDDSSVVVRYTSGHTNLVNFLGGKTFAQEAEDEHIVQAKAQRLWREALKRCDSKGSDLRIWLKGLIASVEGADDALQLYYVALCALEGGYLPRGNDGRFRSLFDTLINNLREGTEKANREMGNRLVIDAGRSDLRVENQSTLFDAQFKFVAAELGENQKVPGLKLYILAGFAAAQEEFDRIATLMPAIERVCGQALAYGFAHTLVARAGAGKNIAVPDSVTAYLQKK